MATEEPFAWRARTAGGSGGAAHGSRWTLWHRACILWGRETAPRSLLPSPFPLPGGSPGAGRAEARPAALARAPARVLPGWPRPAARPAAAQRVSRCPRGRPREHHHRLLDPRGPAGDRAPAAARQSRAPLPYRRALEAAVLERQAGRAQGGRIRGRLQVAEGIDLSRQRAGGRVPGALRGPLPRGGR